MVFIIQIIIVQIWFLLITSLIKKVIYQGNGIMLVLLKLRLVIFIGNLTDFLFNLRLNTVYIGKNIILKYLRSIIAINFLRVDDFF